MFNVQYLVFIVYRLSILIHSFIHCDPSLELSQMRRGNLVKDLRYDMI